MPAVKNNILKDFEVTRVKIMDFADCDEVKDLGNGNEIKFPLKITIGKGNEGLLTERTTATRTTKNWTKKFYQNADGYWNYTRDNALLAVWTILIKTNPDAIAKCKTDKGLDVNKLIGAEFDAVVTEAGSGVKFINWISTFAVNDIETPENTIDNSKQVTQSLTSQEKEQKAIKDNSLPF